MQQGRISYLADRNGNDNRRRGTFNIGVVIFSALFVYLIIMLVMYLTAGHISTYMVTEGTLSQNENYTALALRSEQVVTAPESGTVSYYVQDGDKASKDTCVCSIGDAAEEESVQSSSETEPDDSEMEQIRSLASAFSGAWRSDEYDSVYHFRYSLQSMLANHAGTGRTISGTRVKTPSDGVIAYTTDGLEGLKAEDVTADDFDRSSHASSAIQSDTAVSSGDPVFRVITDDTWELVFPVSDRQYASLSSRSVIKVRFEKDGLSENGDLSLFDKDGTHYALVTLYSGMVRYCDDRYLDIELVTNTVSGLKIPISSIVNKEFYVIPVSFEVSGGDDGQTSGFIRQTKDENGNQTTEFVEADLYEKTTLDDGTEVYYVDEDTFSEGDIIIQTDSRSTYTVGNVSVLEGVYCTNLGYAQFRKVNILDQNEEYAIVAEGTDYGISQYDYIVRDGTDVDESQILHES